MRYQCITCGSEFKPGKPGMHLPPVNSPEVHCPFCENRDCIFEEIPEPVIYQCMNCFSEWRYGERYGAELESLPDCPFCGCVAVRKKEWVQN